MSSTISDISNETWEALKTCFTLWLPYLVAFSCASWMDLKTWIALQKTPLLLVGSEETPASRSRRKLMGFSLIGLYVVFFESIFLVKNSALREALYGVVALIIGSALIVITYHFFADMLGLRVKSVHRKGDGSFVFRTVYEPEQNLRNKVKMIQAVICVIAACLAASVFWNGSSILIGIFSIFISYYVTKNLYLSRLSFRRVALIYICFLVADLIFTAFIIFVRRGHSTKDAPEQAPEDPKGFWEEMVVNFTWLYNPVMSFLPGVVVALALRFDYQRHLDILNSDATSDFGIQTIPPPAPDLSVGAIAPSNAPRGFNKIYYLVSLATWATTHAVVLLAAFSQSSLSFSKMMMASSLAGFLLEPPTILVAIVAVAFKRGELDVLWRYQEEWSVKKGQTYTLL